MTFDTAISPSDMVGETIVVSKYESSTGKRGWADSLGLGACSWEPSVSNRLPSPSSRSEYQVQLALGIRAIIDYYEESCLS